MEIRDWIMISSAVIIVAGWFVNGLLNRRHEIAKKRMEYRLETLHSFLPIVLSVNRYENPFEQDQSLLCNLEKSRSNFELYGLEDEISMFQVIVEAIESRDVDSFNLNLNKFTKLVRARIRNELGLST